MIAHSSNVMPPSPAAVSQAIRVAVLDDHVVVCFGIRLLLETRPGYAWTGAASTPAELFKLLASSSCHILVLDYKLSLDEIDGWSLVRYLRAHYPHLRILIYTAYPSNALAGIMRRAGAHGFLGKEVGLGPLLDAIQRIAAGARVFPPETNDVDASTRLEGIQVELSPRENEVLRCCIQGMSVTDIARKFRRSIKTISAQKRAGYRKLGVSNDHEFLLRYAHTQAGSAWKRL